MKVKELIEILKGKDREAEIYTTDHDGNRYGSLSPKDIGVVNIKDRGFDTWTEEDFKDFEEEWGVKKGDVIIDTPHM